MSMTETVRPSRGGTAWGLLILIALAAAAVAYVYFGGYDITIDGHRIEDVNPIELLIGLIVGVLAAVIGIAAGLVGVFVGIGAALIALILAAFGIAAGLLVALGAFLGPILLIAAIVMLARESGKRSERARLTARD